MRERLDNIIPISVQGRFKSTHPEIGVGGWKLNRRQAPKVHWAIQKEGRSSKVGIRPGRQVQASDFGSKSNLKYCFSCQKLMKNRFQLLENNLLSTLAPDYNFLEVFQAKLGRQDYLPTRKSACAKEAVKAVSEIWSNSNKILVLSFLISGQRWNKIPWQSQRVLESQLDTNNIALMHVLEGKIGLSRSKPEIWIDIKSTSQNTLSL